ncbi:MAG: PAS domain S-box protein, partial [Chthoniobacteraceae bacterium]
MEAIDELPDPETAISGRTAVLLREHLDGIHRRRDRLFADLMVLQWLAGIAAALWISPKTWLGAQSQTHPHLWAAIFLGGVIAIFPILLVRSRPGWVVTRHVIAIAQMLTSALLIHLTGGRIETHFHVFGSLAFLAFYRDWRVLVTATLVTTMDHFARGFLLPQSVFGVLAVSPWRWAEHAGWVLFEDAFLFISIRQSWREMQEMAGRRARLERLNGNIENQVVKRTFELATAVRQAQASEQRFRMLSASAPIGIFETDAAGRLLYVNPELARIGGLTPEKSSGEAWRRALHPEDAARVLEAWARVTQEGRPLDIEHRFAMANGEVHWVHVRSAMIRSASGEIAGHVGTVEDITDAKCSKAELEKLNHELIEISRQAGMAEVATGVLHNVGNVLNSVNVAANCVADGLRRSKVGSLDRAAALLCEHEADLAGFFTRDPRAAQLPRFLKRLAGQLADERQAAVDELALLQKSVDHIKDIVSM